MDVNSGLEFGILIDLGLDLKFEMIFQLWLFIWVGFFAQLSWFCRFLTCFWNFEFGDYFVIMSMIGFVYLVQWFCFHELIQIWMFSFEFVFFELELPFVVIFNLVGQF